MYQFLQEDNKGGAQAGLGHGHHLQQGIPQRGHRSQGQLCQDQHLCSTLTGSVTSLGRTAGWTGTRGHLTDSTTIKDHNAVAHVHEAPSHGKSVVETGMEEIMKDVATVQSVSPQ